MESPRTNEACAGSGQAAPAPVSRRRGQTRSLSVARKIGSGGGCASGGRAKAAPRRGRGREATGSPARGRPSAASAPPPSPSRTSARRRSRAGGRALASASSMPSHGMPVPIRGRQAWAKRTEVARQRQLPEQQRRDRDERRQATVGRAESKLGHVGHPGTGPTMHVVPRCGLDAAQVSSRSLVPARSSRTPDLRITNALLYQLSYAGVACGGRCRRARGAF